MKSSIKIILVVFMVIFFSFKFINLSHAESVLFSDDFEDNSFENWQIISGFGLWEIQEILNSSRFGARSSLVNIEAQAGDFSWTDYELSIDILPNEGWDRNLFFRVTGERSYLANLNLPSGYALHMSPSWIDLQKWTPGVVSSPDLSRASVSWPTGEVRTIHVKLKGNNIQVFEDSNQNPTIDYTDNSTLPILTGRIALVITTGASNPSEVWFDNIVVKSLAPALPSLDVPDIKQYSLPWKNEQYDHAKTWSSNPTIERWGCALTSASMVLKYFGHEDATPDVLNDWLTNEPDGYLRNGLLNWLALSRYTANRATLTSPALSYRKFSPENSVLINELSQNRPSIVKEPGHYVVVKSQTENSFGINDPAYEERETLASYQNTLLGIESYLPTNTDLSYILLTLDSNIILKVMNSNGEEVSNNQYLEAPLRDDIGQNEPSGEQLKMFLLPQPLDGDYQIETSGPIATYTLDSFLYNRDGSVEIGSFAGIAAPSNVDVFVITKRDRVMDIVQKISVDSLIFDLDNAWVLKNIRPRFFYKILRAELNLSKKLIMKNRPKMAIIILKEVLNQIRSSTPVFVSSQVSSILQNNLQLEIDTL